MEPQKIPIKIAVDDRGFLYQIFESKKGQISFDGKNFLSFPPVKRIYVVGNFSKSTIRGMHFHKNEWKYFSVIKGSAKFVVSPTENISENSKTFILSDKYPEVLIVPPKNFNGWVALEDNTIIIGMSNFSLEESLQDDYRVPPDNFLELFKVKNR
jgi:dTDP-4-dehydrorhamnose 3,5-epimerase